MGKLSKLKTGFLAALTLLSGVGINLALPLATHAAAQVGITPPKNEVVLQPGQTYTSSFRIYNNGDETLHYTAYVTPYRVSSDDSGATTNLYDGSEAESSYSTITDWITVDTESGIVEPGDENAYINYTITVPENATPGGQYAAIMVEQDVDEESSSSAGIVNRVRAAYLVQTTVAGNVEETATISEVNIPGIFVDSKITASSMVENTGNVHGYASYALQVFPLFSDEELYTTEEEPETQFIYPGTKYYNQLTWEDTPSIGIYRVVETVSLFGESTSTERIVVVCPLWLILVIAFVIVFIVVWLIVRSKKRKHNAGVQHA